MTTGRRLAVTLIVAAVVTVTAACGSDDPVLEPPTRTAEPGQAGGCSAAGLSSTPDEQPDLPDAVTETRRLIVGAATSCGYARLAHVAGRGDHPFSYTFGEPGDASDAAAFWRQQEARGEEPMRFLAGLLNRPHARRDLPSGEVQYVWPAAFVYDAWDDVPAGEQEALRPLYDDADFAEFEAFGGYAGYRVGIAADGEWLFFVAGD